MDPNWLFERLAPWYDRAVRRMGIGPLRDRLALPIAGRLLDLGGGTGRVARAVQDQVGTAVVADVAWGMLRVARRWPGLRLVQALAERLPFADETFDRIVIVDALHHFIDAEAAIQEAARALRPGGTLLIEEPDITRWPVKAIAAIERLLGLRSRFRPGEAIRAIAEAVDLQAHLEPGPALRWWVIGHKIGPAGPSSGQTAAHPDDHPAGP